MKKYLNKEYLLENKKKLIKIAIILLIAIVAIASFNTKSNKDEDEIPVASDSYQEETNSSENDTSALSSTLIIDISGEVEMPDVVELPDGSRIQDAIEAAGGLTEEADISTINRAELLKDGQKIIIPSIEDKNATTNAGTSSTTNGSSLININTANSEQLQQIKGVGPTTAEKIITYRETNGNFNSIEDIKNVSGIGEKTYEKLKDQITV